MVLFSRGFPPGRESGGRRRLLHHKNKEPELSVPTEPPRVMGVWASEKLFKNYPNDY